MESKLKTKIKTDQSEKKKLINKLWKIRREENFTSWKDLKKELNLV